MSSGSKGGGSAASRSYNYHGTIACVVCSGPVDELFGIEVDDDLVYSSTILRSSSSNPVNITIPDRGLIRFYWGTETQSSTDAALVVGGNNLGHGHPAYPGICYAVLVNFLFGRERTSAPNIRFRVRRKPVQSLITGAAADLVDGQANPFAVMAELFTSERFGRGLASSNFSLTKWQQAADAAYARNSDCYISTHLDRQVNGLTYARDIFGLCDGFLRMEFGSRLCEAGLFPRPETINPAALTLIDSAALSSPAKWQPQTWDDIVTRVTASYTDRDHNFKERSVRYDDPRARVMIGDNRSLDLESRFIVRAEQAKNHAIETGRRLAIPGLSGQVPARQSRTSTIRPGEHIRLDIDPEPGGLRLEQVCRVLSVSRSPLGPATIRVESERTLAPVAYVEPVAPENPIANTVPEIANARLFEVPPPLAEGEEFFIGVLAERPGDIVTDCAICYDTADETDSAFPQIGSHRNYALRGRLNAAYASNATGTVSVEILGARDREIIAENPDQVGARDDTLLMIVFGAAITSPTYRLPLEVFSVVESVSAGTNLINVTAFRRRAGTEPLAHAVNAEVWFIRRDLLPLYRHRDFKARSLSAESCFFKLQPSSFLAVRPLADVTAREFQFDGVRVFAPVINLTTPVNDAGKEYVSVSLNGSVDFTGSVTDSDGNLQSVKIVATTNNSPEEVLLERAFSEGQNFTLGFSVSCPTEGNKIVTIRATDSTQRQVEKRVHLLVGSVATNKLALPVLDSLTVEEEEDSGSFTGSYYMVALFSCPELPPGANVVIDYAVHWGWTPPTSYSTSAGPSGQVEGYYSPAVMPIWARSRDTTSTYQPSDWTLL